MSLLSLIQTVTALLSLPVPATVVGSSDRQVLQMLALANEEGQTLASAHNWQILNEEFRFTTTATQSQATSIPSDLARWLPNSFFNRTTRRPITGPITPRQWQWIQAQPVYSTVYLAFRERTGTFLFAPTPPAGQSIYGEYISKNWCQSIGLVGQSTWQADTDTALLDETLMALGLRWRFLKAKGLEYGEDFATYERQVEQARGNDGGSTMLSLAPQPVDLNRVNLPDGSFGV